MIAVPCVAVTVERRRTRPDPWIGTLALCSVTSDGQASGAKPGRLAAPSALFGNRHVLPFVQRFGTCKQLDKFGFEPVRIGALNAFGQCSYFGVVEAV